MPHDLVGPFGYGAYSACTKGPLAQGSRGFMCAVDNYRIGGYSTNSKVCEFFAFSHLINILVRNHSSITQSIQVSFDCNFE